MSNFEIGFAVGALFMVNIFVIVAIIVSRSRAPRIKMGEDLSRRGDQLIQAGNNPETWKNTEQREAWINGKEQWQQEVKKWKST